MKIASRLVCLLLAWTLACPPATAAPAPTTQTWPIDAARSQAHFSVRRFWVAHVRGTFPGLKGTLRRIDTGAGLVEVDATIDVTALVMDDTDQRTYALGPHFFDAAHFPAARFQSDPFPLAELAKGGVLRGLLQLHGERHPVTFTLLPSDCPRQPLHCVIRVEGSLARSAFGMRAWRGILGNKVHLSLRILLDECAACLRP